MKIVCSSCLEIVQECIRIVILFARLIITVSNIILQLLIYVSMTLKLFLLITICSLAVYVETVFNINYLNGIYKFYEILN